VVLAMRRGFTLLRSYVTVTDGVARNRALQEQAVLDRRRVPRPGWNGAAWPRSRAIGRGGTSEASRRRQRDRPRHEEVGGPRQRALHVAPQHVISLSESHVIRAAAMPLLVAAGSRSTRSTRRNEERAQTAARLVPTRYAARSSLKCPSIVRRPSPILHRPARSRSCHYHLLQARSAFRLGMRDEGHQAAEGAFERAFWASRADSGSRGFGPWLSLPLGSRLVHRT
jgi:hypothetical protein